MIATALARGVAALAPGAPTVLLHGVRLLPVALTCPLLGGPLVPPALRAVIAFGIGACAASATGAAPVPTTALALLVASLRELSLGVALATVAAMPFEAARAGGRLVDTLRGATLSELHVAPIRQRESATGDLLAQWVIVLSATAGGDRLVVAALLETFRAVPAGVAVAPAHVLPAGLRSAAELLSCALALGAPSAAGVLAAELALAFAARVAPQLQVSHAAQPARAAVGLVTLGVASAALAGRLTSAVALSAALVHAATGAAP